MAVLLVVLDHARIGPFHGGFVGVDVFFVISGFLITGLLVNEAQRTHRISLLGFYARRAKRIIPAATVVLAATAFTLAHSVTFILAATGVVSVPAEIVEPIIALSIAVVAGWYLWRLWRRKDAATSFDSTGGPLGLDRAGWVRIAVVFLFGLVHGLGFASALGIDEPWSWTLLWSLLVFNLGIECVQLVIIAALFPLLMLLRRRAPRVGLWVTGALATAVSLAGLVWFVERLLGL